MLCGNERVTASVTAAIYEWNGQQIAMSLFDEKGIVSQNLFHLIDWEGFGKVMTK